MPGFENCNHRLEVSSVDIVAGTSMNLHVPDQAFFDYGVYTLITPGSFAAHQGNEVVSIVSNGVVIPCVNRAGNVLYSGRLRGHSRYRIVYGSDTAHFLFFDGLRPMEYSATASLMG
jgi:hypothetical protein